MHKFIYVFNTKSRDTLIDLGYEEVEFPTTSNLFVFINNGSLSHDLPTDEYIEDDVLVL